MFPILIDLGTHDLPLLGETHLFLPTYGFLFALGVLVAWGWIMRRSRELGVDRESAFNLSFYTLLAGLVGAKLTLIVVDWRHYSRHPADILETVRSAGVLMGGVAVAVVVFVAYARRQGLPTWALADAWAAPVALAQSVGRLGCLSAGCCYGVETRHPWFAVTFTDPRSSARLGVPLVPTQIVQMVNDLVLALVLTWLWSRRPRPDGTVFWWYVLLYSAGRGIIEIWRGDAERGIYFGNLVSTSQILAVLAALLAVVMLLRGWSARREART